jgi:diguanylate cyclase (GGDEF)-like protein/PAS domain S-box-containing protein
MAMPLVRPTAPSTSRDGGAADALNRSERRLQGILNTATEAFIAFDAEGLILDWNSAAARIFGWEYLDALGRRLSEMFHLPDEPLGRGDLTQLLIDEPFSLKGETQTRRFRLQGVRRDGQRFPVEMAVSRQRAGESHVCHAFLRDLSEQERAERERREAEEKLSYQALHDGLTGLANRTLLMDRLEHALGLARRRGSTVAVLFVDLDNFKLINETVGHWAGDAVLVEVAERLRHTMRASDTRARRGQETMARMGGDEFVLVCEDVTSEADATAIAAELAESLSAPMLLSSGKIRLTVSIGIAMASSGASAHSLLRDADAATYRAKERGGARFELFDTATRARILERQQRETELRRAIEEEQLRLHYQPIVSASSGEIVAAEALVRWQHPERGLLGPYEFLPLAERVGLINPLGKWVLEQACAQAIRWRSLRGEGTPLRVSVNVSGHQLTRDNSQAVLECVQAHQALDPSLLSLEITETVLLQDGEAPVEALAALRELGVEILLDDFGTGYSSLSYLHRLPLDGIKLDRTFIASITGGRVHREITRAVIQMAQALDLKVVAEGVETEDQLACLRALQCPLLQGFYFSKPLPVEEMTGLLGGRDAA